MRTLAALSVLLITLATSSGVAGTTLLGITNNATVRTSVSINYVVVIVMENHPFNYSSSHLDGIIGNPSAPFINRLASNYSLTNNYWALTNGSIPNYMALTSGNLTAVNGNCLTPSPSCSTDSLNIVDRIQASGRTWKAYMEDYSGGCNGVGGALYAARHNPFIFYSNIRNNATRCSHIVSANPGHTGLPDSQFLSDLNSTLTASNFMWLTPNVCNDMHDCTVSTGDSYLSQLVPQVLNSTLFRTQGAALLITFDEPGTCTYTVCGVTGVWAGPSVRRNYSSNVRYDHYSVLATLESIWNLPALTSKDNLAFAMDEFFQDHNPITSSPGPTIGWGGPGINSTIQYGGFGAGTPPLNWPSSKVFPGQKASDFELEAQHVSGLGYNLIRLSIAPACNRPSLMTIFGGYNSTQLAMGLKIALFYNLWIDVDYHAYHDMQNSTIAACWLNFWKPIVQQFSNSYPKILWEPLNEPLIPPFDQTAVNLESGYYQQWINQARAFGDRHSVIVQNLCSQICTVGNWTLAFPTVTDPQNRVYISLHRSFSYAYYWQTWDNATADSEALRFYSFELQGAKKTGWPVLVSEFWTGSQTNGTATCPDLVQLGSAGYCKTQLEWVNKFVSYMDHNTPARIGWQGWTIGDWTDNYGCTILGALSPTGCPGKAVVPGWGYSSLVHLPLTGPGVTGIQVSLAPSRISAARTLHSTLNLLVTMIVTGVSIPFAGLRVRSGLSARVRCYGNESKRSMKEFRDTREDLGYWGSVLLRDNSVLDLEGEFCQC